MCLDVDFIVQIAVSRLWTCFFPVLDNSLLGKTLKRRVLEKKLLSRVLEVNGTSDGVVMILTD